jgi:mannose/fructose/N-acetylgalactosamine-specific phosphotransferase system component IIB
MQNEKESRFGAANFLGALPSNGVAIATIKDRIAERQHVCEFVKMTEATNVVTGKKWQDTVTPCEAPRTEIDDTRRKQVNAVDDEGCTETVTATKEVISVHEEATVHLDCTLLAADETDDLCEGVRGQIAVESVGTAQDLEEADTPPTEYLNIEDELDTEMEESDTSALTSSVIDDGPTDQGEMVMDQCLQGGTNSALQTVSRNAYQQGPCVQEFGISINSWSEIVEARTIPLHRLRYQDASWEGCIPSVGQRNMMHKKMVNGRSVRHWACINISQYVTVAMAPQLCNELMEMCRTSGMVFEMNPMLAIQYTAPEHCDGVSFLNRTRTAVLENNQSSSDKEVVVINKKVAQDNFGKTSNEVCLADEHKKRARLSDISEDIHSATTKASEKQKTKACCTV